METETNRKRPPADSWVAGLDNERRARRQEYVRPPLVRSKGIDPSSEGYKSFLEAAAEARTNLARKQNARG